MQRRSINTMKAAHTIESSTGLNKKTGTILAILAFILVATIAGYFLVNQVQNPAKRADEGKGISLSGPSCPANGFTCKWSRQPGISYHYAIKDSDGTTVKEGDIPAGSGTDKITITHTPEADKTYTCSVTATNDCGSVSDQKSALCSAVPQPTLIEISLTPTSTPSPTSPETTPSITPTGTISPTVAVSVTPSKTPTPTDIIIAHVTSGPTSSQPSSTPKKTANPTLPTTGGISSLSMIGAILVGFIVVTFGLIL